MVKIGRGAPVRMATGQYTGDGTLSQAITGIGFRPRYVKIWYHQTAQNGQDVTEAMDQFPTVATLLSLRDIGVNWYWRDEQIISLDADGFSVSDDNTNAHPNTATAVYDFLCLG